jgi:hypothetical protein
MTERDWLAEAAGPGEAEPLGWLVVALQPPAGTPSFQARCSEAAAVAHAIARLRYAGQRFSYPRLSVPAYLRGLAAVAQIPLDGVLRWAGLGLDGPSDPAFARGWSRLARALGLGQREALWHLRLTFAEAEEVEPQAHVPARIAANRGARGPGRDPLAASYESLLAGIIAGWDESTRSRLQECEQVVRDDFRAADRDDPLAG